MSSSSLVTGTLRLECIGSPQPGHWTTGKVCWRFDVTLFQCAATARSSSALSLNRQGGRMSISVPSSGPGTAVVGSALPSRNKKAIITTMGRMTSAKTNSASATRWLLTAAFRAAKLAGISVGVAVITLDILRLPYREPGQFGTLGG